MSYNNCLNFILLRQSKAFPGKTSIRAKGWEKIDRLASSRGALNQAFVAMWFDETTDKIFEVGIKPAVEHDSKTNV